MARKRKSPDATSSRASKRSYSPSSSEAFKPLPDLDGTTLVDADVNDDTLFKDLGDPEDLLEDPEERPIDEDSLLPDVLEEHEDEDEDEVEAEQPDELQQAPPRSQSQVRHSLLSFASAARALSQIPEEERAASNDNDGSGTSRPESASLLRIAQDAAVAGQAALTTQLTTARASTSRSQPPDEANRPLGRTRSATNGVKHVARAHTQKRADRPDKGNIYQWYLNVPKVKAAPENDILPDQLVGPYLKIMNVDDKGRILVTTEPIAAGTLLLQERALLADIVPLASKGKADSAAYKAALRRKIYELDDEPRRQFLRLCHERGKDTEESRIKCNAFNIAGTENVWYYTSIINHSCIPNTYVEQYGTEIGYNLRALADIDAGDEITLNYKPDFILDAHRREDRAPALIENRKRQIQEQWGFECGCLACQDPEGTDENHTMLNRQHAAITGSIQEDPNKPTIERIGRINSALMECIPHMEYYNYTQTLFKVLLEVVTFFRKFPKPSDALRTFISRWERKALDAGVTLYGMESIEDLHRLFAIAEEGQKSVENIRALSERIAATMQEPFSTSVMVGQLKVDFESDKAQAQKTAEEEANKQARTKKKTRAK